MPMIDRLASLGLLDDDEPEVRPQKSVQAKKEDGSSSSNSNDEDDYDHGGGSEDSSDSDDDSIGSNTSITSAMLEAEAREDEAVKRVIATSQGMLARLGHAEGLRQTQLERMAKDAEEQQQQQQQNQKTKHKQKKQKSAATQHFVPVKYPTGDDDASEGFYLCGFKDGRRVYRLFSPHLQVLQNKVARTAVGLCYLDIDAMCPPTVVAQPRELLPSTPSTPSSSPSPPSSPSSPSPPPHILVNGCFAIRPSPLGGLGAFALRDLQRGDHLLVERPLLRTTLFHLSRLLDELSPADRSVFYSLTGHHPDPQASQAERIWTANTFVAGDCEAIFALASRFNHACAPPRANVGYRFDPRHGVLVMTAIGRIAAGSELLISYGKTPPMLFERFGFRCTCGMCAGFEEEEEKRFYMQQWQ